MKKSLLFCIYLDHFVLISSHNVILDSVIRHDHGYFIMEDRNNLSYTIMATGDNRELEDGRLDRGRGRVFYFSSHHMSPITISSHGLVMGDNNHDSALKITKSRDLVKQYLGSNSK